ncbi:glutamine--tRNA ligase/YqeY domain fusion protein [candidate division GN15 bacterium]|nr:glutamine--tRNA ligase/YqeY domain fusion protein [candidate division GN15 bacterium]
MEKTDAANTKSNFVRDIVEEDLRNNKNDGRVHTRFPPEPNGYLHIGHAKAFCLDFGIAEEFGGRYNLRFDDTNPIKEEAAFVEGMKEDIRWMGYDWEDREFYASDYFPRLYEFAVQLIRDGKAYVDDLSADEIREYRGTLTEPGRESPHRNRSVEENLDLFERMNNGEFPNGSKVLRAKIDMASPNLNMRDPVMYRVLHATHHRTGDEWCIYPMYDWAHGQSDSIEGITHSLCDLSFEDHRPLYDWFLDQLGIHHPQQIEFARLNLSYTITSKRKLRRLIDEGYISDWDDPRMPTLRGLRRRGFTPAAIREFMERIGVAKRESIVDVALLEHLLRDDLNRIARRVMVVLDPIKVVITNYPDGQTEMLEAINNPENAEDGTREIPFSGELYIERADFMEDPPKKFFRLSPGKEVRLKHAYFIKCEQVIKDDAGNVTELRCSYDPATKSGEASDGRKVKGTLHWVSAKDAIDIEVRLYDRLFVKEDPDEDDDFTQNVNPNSLEILTGCKAEPGLAGANPETRYQFLRQGYFCADSVDSKPGTPVFNRTVGLRDSWAKMQKKNK